MNIQLRELKKKKKKTILNTLMILQLKRTFDDLYSRQLCVFDLFVFSVPRVRLCSPVERTSADA